MATKLKTKDLRPKKNPNSLIFIGILLLVAVILITKNLDRVSFKKETPDSSKVQVTPTKIPFEPPTGDKIRVSEVELPNFYKSSSTMNDNGDQLIYENERFSIIFFPKGKQFLISIGSSPFSRIRAEAEIEFLKVLDVSEEEACKLTVLITTPRFVNPQEAGKEYRLSYCESK